MIEEDSYSLSRDSTESSARDSTLSGLYGGTDDEAILPDDILEMLRYADSIKPVKKKMGRPRKDALRATCDIKRTNAIMCKYCYDVVHEQHSLCRCGNVGVLVDDDGHMHVYVEAIKSVQRVILYHIGDYKEIRRELLSPFDKAVYANYNFYDDDILFKPYATSRDKPRTTSTEYDDRLVNALTQHFYTTSDGKEKFKRTTLKDRK